MMQSLSKKRDIACAVSLFVYSELLGKEVAYGGIFRSNGTA